ncbi:unnamed protein product [Rotaria sordida]|uniref:Erythromycin biosynthesis protein CIII-like C-terminal domain-containing protein n=2 Tax=Rotaria sordida TaxID=392033 RepID=A0A819STC9_9BILA|nr:unnamed protein product [Rotaria sordida]
MVKTAGIDTVELGGDLEIALKTTSAGIELQRNPSIFKMGVFKRLFSPLIEEWFNGISSINLPPLKFNYYQMIQATMKKPMTTATIYSKHLIARPTDWQENDHIVGPILDEDQHNFEPSPTLLDFFNKWKSEKIIFVGLGSMMGAMLANNEQIQFLNNIQAALKNNNCKAVISLVGYQQTDINNLSNTDNIFYLKQIIPHSWLFLNVSAVIHHGGAGTTHASLRYGLPTLILSFVVDQPFNGDRIFINKLGPRHIPMAKTNVKNLTNAIHDLINRNYSMYQMNAKKISELIKNEDGLGQCVRLIEAELAK